MSSVVRVSSGDTIQIRTGILQGIGPQGPTGPTGPQGLTGPAGPQGEPGPQGELGEFVTEARVIAAQSVATSTNTLLQFDSILVDEYSAMKSATNIEPGLGNFYLMAYVRFSKQSSVAASGLRAVRLLEEGTTIWGQTVQAAPTAETEMTLNAAVRITDAETTFSIQVRQEEGVTLQVLAARLWLCRTGSGPRGLQGPVGPQGPIGPVGPEGPQGPAGTVGNNNTTFAQLEAGTG